MHVHKWDERQILIPVGANQQRGSTLKSVKRCPTLALPFRLKHSQAIRILANSDRTMFLLLVLVVQLRPLWGLRSHAVDSLQNHEQVQPQHAQAEISMVEADMFKKEI